MHPIRLFRAFWLVLLWLLPLLATGYLLVLVSRAVRALESIAESLRERHRP